MMSALALLALVVVPVMGDLPVHCMHPDVSLLCWFPLCCTTACSFSARLRAAHLTSLRGPLVQIIGTWTFFKGVDGKSPRVKCGHHQPDDVDGPNLGYPGKKRPNLKIESQVRLLGCSVRVCVVG
jgi:hypothetical protein